MKRRDFVKMIPAAALIGGGQTKASTPFDGYWVPEESEPHARTFMQWPASRVVHPDGVFLRMLQQSIADIANSIVDFEPVVMLMDPKYAPKARRILSDTVEIWDIPTDDLWARDSGPIFLRNEAGALVVGSVNFNGWGNKQAHKNDGKVARRVAERLDIPFLNNGIAGEAGGVESDGHGTLIAHESSWVNPNRNKLSRAQIEARLLELWGAEKMIWAPGVAGADITDYHIDSLARFTKAGQVIIQMPEAITKGDPWSRAAFETFDIIANSRDAEGRKINMVVIEEPLETRIKSEDFVASYVNYYVCNGAVIAAEFGDDYADGAARELLAALYPNRKIVMLNVDPIGEVGGGIHCATHEMPAT